MTGPVGRARRARRSVTARHVVGRQWWSDPGTVALLAVVVLMAATVLTAWPRAVDHLLGADLEQSVDRLSAAQRDVSIAARMQGSPEHPDQVLPAAVDSLAEVARSSAGPALAAVLGEPEVVLTRIRTPVEKGDDAPDVVAMTLALRTDQHVTERVRLVEGEVPAVFEDDAGAGGDLAAAALAVADGPVLEVMMSVSTADRMRWQVGQERELLDPSLPATVRLSGTFEARDPQAGVWSHLESTLFPFVVEDGNVGTTVHGVAYTDPSALTVLPHPQGMISTAWFPVGDLADADRGALTAQLRGLLAATGGTTELEGTLEAAEERHRTLTTILGVLVSGPTGVALGVLWLGAVLAVERRRAALRLAGARGAARGHLALVTALESTVVSVPAAAVGAALATSLVRGGLGPRDLAVPLLVGLAPPVLAALAVLPVLNRSTAREVGRRRGRRPVVELAVMALAVFAVLSARTRGLGGPVDAIDPFLVAAPLLVTAAMCVVVLRLYPPTVRALTRTLHRRPRLPNFLGAARAARAPVGGVVPLVALVLGVAVAVLSATVLSTVQGGIGRTAARDVGADLRLDAVSFTADDRATVAAANGVAAVAAVGQGGREVLDVGGTDEQLELVTVDSAALEAVQEGLPGVDPLPGLVGAEASGPVPALFATGDRLPLGRVISFDRRDSVLVEPLGERVEVPGVSSGRAWFVTDRETLRAATGVRDVVDRLLVRLEPGAAPDDVLALIVDGLDPTTVETLTTASRAGAEDRLRDGVLIRGLETGLVVITATTALLVAVLVLLSLAVGAPARSRLVALLSVLGAPRTAARTLVLWEVGPLALVAAAAGAVVGALLPRLLLPVTDLRLFTGGVAQPPVVTDPGVVALLSAGCLLVVTVAVTFAVVARRTPAALVLREGERP